MYVIWMEFVFDPQKRAINLAKHDVDFAGVLPAFSDPKRLVWEDCRFDYGEVRFNMLAISGNRLFHVTYTVREDTIRLISARVANRKEMQRYVRPD